MAKHTVKAILKTFEEMLTEKSFSKITVTELVRRCDISPNAFYYHYENIYKLLEAWIKIKMQEFSVREENVTDGTEIIREFLYAVKRNPDMAYHVADSLSHETFARIIFDVSEEDFYSDFMRRLGPDGVPEERLRGISRCCCYSLWGLFLKFLWLRTEMDIDAEVRCICDTFTACLNGLK